MGVSTIGYIFKKVGQREFLEGLTEIPNLEIIFNDVKKDKNMAGYVSGSIGIQYKGFRENIFVFIRQSTDEYVRLFENWNGLDEVRGNIPNYGKSQFVLSMSAHSCDESIKIISLILKKFGGVLIPNDCNEDRPMKYLSGAIDTKITYPRLGDVPDFILAGFVRDYLNNCDIAKINNRLHNKIRGMDLLKEFAIRNLDK